MKHSITVCASVIVLALLTDVLAAQQPGGWGRRHMGRPGQPGGDRPMHGQGFRPPPPPLMTALDADNDGELSAKEIKRAVAALKKLDKNKDGKLSREELRPARPGGPNPQGGFQPGAGPRRQGGPRQPGGQGGNLFERLMSFDRNRDGKVDKRELPPAMQPVLGRADANNDGAIDRAEAQKMFQQVQRDGRGGGRGEGGFRRGDGQGRGQGRHGAGRGGRQGGERPQKPRAVEKDKDKGKDKDKDDDDEISFF